MSRPIFLLALACLVFLPGCLDGSSPPRFLATGTHASTVLPASAAAPAENATQRHAVPIETDMYDPGFWDVDAGDCPGHGGGVCRFQSSGVAYFNGSIVGSYAYHAYADLMPNGTLIMGDDGWMVATIPGCGTGAFAMHLDGYTSPAMMIEKRGMYTVDTMTVVPGTASAGFGSLEGAMHSSDAHFRDPVTRQNDAHWSGNFTCSGP